ncbi:hypothetical protein MHZ92_14395 [Sporosarcina sp. ACRSL]|uniref:hypothetical protein n=1 Tax=Sporosarcina sp. ACRSL TaxID=2918215 RepID=UPI001EF57696|nr:hypothetical protein [Sporosarcina sp. ACRSL]MCG7345326.1 hypothetical protein [Sporosarcina sp. ACRSL]
MTITTEFNYGHSTVQFAEYVSLLFGIAKAGDGKTDVQGRIAAVQRMTDAYFECRGVIPDSAQLDRLASLILRDELTDDTPYKTRNTEYPIESERQELDYYKGLTTRNVPESVGVDGTDYRIPTRRQRTPAENAYMDRKYKAKER